MNRSPKRQTVTYIVRVWVEYLQEQPPSWRGEIELVGRGRKTHFSHLHEMIDFIQRQSIQPITEDPS